MKPLEIPYNFDKNLITLLSQLDSSGKMYSCIYMPPFKFDYVGAKHNYIHSDNNSVNKNFPNTREEYVSHVNNIMSYFPNKLMLLLQQKNCCMPADLLRWYYQLGFKRFCVGSVQQAHEIRKLFSDVEIIGSITMKVTPEDLQEDKYSIFDGFVLFFPYNRDLEMIKRLPKKYNYILLVNCQCDITCPGTHHWFASVEEEKNSLQRCPHSYRPDTWENIIQIRPMDLSVFDPYISSYKLQGREYITVHLLRDIYFYSMDWSKHFPSNAFGDESLYAPSKK